MGKRSAAVFERLSDQDLYPAASMHRYPSVAQQNEHHILLDFLFRL
jgi:hypothetical protein